MVFERHPRPPRRKGRGGFVLILVMIVVTMVSLAGLSFVVTLSTENKAAHLHGDQLQLEHVAASGTELLKAICGQSREDQQQMGGMFENPTLFRGVLVVDGQSEKQNARFSVVSPRIEDGRMAGIRFGVQDESARLNLALLPQWEAWEIGSGQRALMNLPGMTEAIADAILDWLDPDGTPRPAGAEAEYYASRGLPYGPRNGVPTSLEELLLVREVGRQALFGLDADFNHLTDETEIRMASGGFGDPSGEGALPWASMLTVYSAERNVTYEGRRRIDLNEKDLAKLYRRLGKAFEPSWTRFIIAYRQFGPERAGKAPSPEDGADLNVVATGPGKARFRRRRGRPADEIDLSLPARFQIESVLDLIGARVELHDPGEEDTGPRQGRVLESPFENDPVLMRDYLPKLADQTTVDHRAVIPGRVNVNEATREVLLGVPGLDPSTVDRIIASRGMRFGQNDPARRHATWLLTDGLVELDQMKRLLPYLTGRGDVFRAQVVAAYGEGGMAARAELVVDGTSSPPRQLYWKDMRLLGRGYPLEVLGVKSTGEASTAGMTMEGFDEMAL
jgi:DNA uptake protein ComE-like DNA-binding protein